VAEHMTSQRVAARAAPSIATLDSNPLNDAIAEASYGVVGGKVNLRMLNRLAETTGPFSFQGQTYDLQTALQNRDWHVFGRYGGQNMNLNYTMPSFYPGSTFVSSLAEIAERFKREGLHDRLHPNGTGFDRGVISLQIEDQTLGSNASIIARMRGDSSAQNKIINMTFVAPKSVEEGPNGHRNDQRAFMVSLNLLVPKEKAVALQEALSNNPEAAEQMIWDFIENPPIGRTANATHWIREGMMDPLLQNDSTNEIQWDKLNDEQRHRLRQNFVVTNLQDPNWQDTLEARLRE